MLVTMKEILLRAQKDGYGVVAANVANENNLRACLEAAEQLEAPLIIGVAYNEFMIPGGDLVRYGRGLVEWCRDCKVPVAINQDHGATLTQAVQAIKAGFTSVMADRSTLPLEENIASVQEVVKVASACGVTVEAELGHVGFVGKDTICCSDGTDTGDSDMFTNVDEAVEFVERTGIDALAVAIGTAHGMYKGTPKLDFQRLAEIRAKVDIPLVLHGGSGTGDENLQRACREGICKVNLASELWQGEWQAVVNVLPEERGRGWFNRAAYKGYQDVLIHYMKLLGQCGKAW